MRLTRTIKPSPFLFQIVPLLNILFAILVFFVLSATFVSQPGITVDSPSSNFSVEPALRSQIISVLGTSQIFFRDRLVSFPELKALLQDKSTRQDTVILKADRATPYDQVISISNLALSYGYRVVLATSSADRSDAP